MSRIRATVMLGKAKTIRKETIKVIQVKRGSRLKVIPGARILRMVTMKFDRPGDGGDPLLQPQEPEVHPLPGVVGPLGEGRRRTSRCWGPRP